MVATRFAVPMAVCLPNPQPFSNSLMFAMLLFLLSHNCRLLRRRRRGNPQAPLRRLPITAERPPLAGVFEFRSGSPGRHAVFQPFLSVTYTAVARGAAKSVEKGFAKAGQPDYNLLILLGIVVRDNFPGEDICNDPCCFRHFPE